MKPWEKIVEMIDKLIASDFTDARADEALTSWRDRILKEYGGTVEPVTPAPTPTPTPEPANPIEKSDRVVLKDHIFMPLFARFNGALHSTWDYLGLPAKTQGEWRSYLLTKAEKDETPAIAFCLTPDKEIGNWFEGGFPKALSEEKAKVLRYRVAELSINKIAPFLTLYVDDAEPRWDAIAKHGAAWRSVNDAVGFMLNGVVLSIETNERALNKAHLEQCIDSVRTMFPGVPLIGTHLQWEARSRVARDDYAWLGCTNRTTPENADFILAEAPWDPHSGRSIDADKFRDVASGILRRMKKKTCFHEYNIEPDLCPWQREYARDVGYWGVG